MPTRSLAEVIDALKTDLTDLDEYGQEIAEAQRVEAELAAKRKQIAELEAETARTVAAIEANNRAAERRRFDDLAEYDRRIRDAREELGTLTTKIADDTALLGRINAATEKSRTQHEYIEARYEAFKKDIGGGGARP